MVEKIVRKQGNPVIKQNIKNGVEFLTFPMLEDTGIADHLFSTRRGGVSEGIYESMNVSYTRGDKKEAVDENFRRIGDILDTDVSHIVCSDQTHTVNIRRAGKEDGGKGIIYKKDYQDIDGLITNIPGLVLATFYADCVPLFFVDTRHKAIGLAHSGWRGTVNRMGYAVLRAMNEAFGTEPGDITAAIGPSICSDCYEVGEDVAEEFKMAFPPSALDEILKPGRVSGKYQLDLWQANLRILLDSGVWADKISCTDICTCCNSTYLFSHRASAGKRGNLGAFLKLRAD